VACQGSYAVRMAKPADLATMIMTGPEPLSEKQLKAITAAPRLKLTEAQEAELIGALDHAAFFYSWMLATKSEWSPSVHEREAIAVATALDKALKLLTDKRGLPNSDLMAWAGYQADHNSGDSAREWSGFIRAGNAVDQVRWLRDMLQGWASRTRESPRQQRGPKGRKSARLEVIGMLLMPAYKLAYRRPMGVGQEGPAFRFVREFLRSCGDRPSSKTIMRLLAEAKRNQGQDVAPLTISWG
jgi:hypothetical protein